MLMISTFAKLVVTYKVNHASVMHWVKAYVEKLPKAPVPEEVYVVEMDELYTFIEEKKQDLHLDLCRSRDPLHYRMESVWQTMRR